MTLPALGRFVTTYPPPRFPAHPRRASTSSTQPGPRPAKRGGRNLGLRYQQLDASIRNTVKNATDSSRSTEEVNPVLVQIKSRVPREGVEMFRGLVIPKEPEPPESDGVCSSRCIVLGLVMILFRMLHVWMRGLRLRSLRGLSPDVQSVACLTPNKVEIHGNPAI